MDNLVSVIIPVFNRFEYADRAILSVLNQTYTHWELFVVDDYSNEAFALPKECENFQQRIVLLRNEKNSGPGLSRQRGLDSSIGKFVCFLDSDDFWKPDFLSESLKVHSAKPELAATYCQSEMTNGILRRRNNIEDAVDDIFYGVVSGARPWATCALIWKRKYISNWSNLRTNQDAYFEVSCSILNNNLGFIPQILCVIDKKTFSNADDLVTNTDSNKNRLITLIYAQDVFLDYIENYKIDCFNLILHRTIEKIRTLLKTKYFTFAIFALFKTFLFYFKYKYGIKISKITE